MADYNQRVCLNGEKWEIKKRKWFVITFLLFPGFRLFSMARPQSFLKKRKFFTWTNELFKGKKQGARICLGCLMERCHRRVLCELALVLCCSVSSQILACKVGDGVVSVFTDATLFRTVKEKYWKNKGFKRCTEQFHAVECLGNNNDNNSNNKNSKQMKFSTD